MNRLPETNKGTVTSWIPIPTAHPHQPGCDKYWWKYVPSIIAAWDPGYGVSVQQDATCLPKPVTTWWLQDRLGPIHETVLSLGPMTCPQDYYTATVDYDFVQFLGPGDTGQCTSELKAGSTITYAQRDPDWKITTSSVKDDTTVAAIPVNGWVFSSPTQATTDSTDNCDASISNALANQMGVGNGTCDTACGNQISAGAAAGIGIGVSLGVTGLAALGAGLFFHRRNRKRVEKRNPATHATQFANENENGNENGKDVNTSAQVYSMYSSNTRETPSPSGRPQYQPIDRDTWDISTRSSEPTHLASHSNARTVPHGEMEGMSYQGIGDSSRTTGLGFTGVSHLDSDEDCRKRTELEGEFDRNVKVSLSTPWIASTRSVPPPPSSSSNHHPPY
ncbi:uncharacterized protein GGS25DRAFT_533594 [Hypoxylon fragiforme]|uniref:uncharacterized protein n=1 Tax=Hypoxylon fragiforme TaxID=63214 RepID=UPI0020C72F1E|nr:uncharacterized protein GGS25DRAFT_533594 [Hypoxylon fragiforme]KAI2606514.1 hypothetical protein GGS25DRAFT_533594 [Hypoxylon fragiforme]